MHDLLALFVIQSSARYPTADEWLNDADPQSTRTAQEEECERHRRSGRHRDARTEARAWPARVLHRHERARTDRDRAVVPPHSYVFDLYSHTPRLILTSPVRGCGKSRTLKVLKQLVRRPRLSGNVTAAVFYHRLENERCSWLLDEGDNLPIYLDPNMRAAFNDGHERGGTVKRMYKGEPKTFHVFAPLAVAAIGRLPLPVMHRSVIMHMKRYAGEESLRRFDSNNADVMQDLTIAWSMTSEWARSRQPHRRSDNAIQFAQSPSR